MFLVYHSQYVIWVLITTDLQGTQTDPTGMKRRESEVSRRHETREDCVNPKKKIQASHAIAESTRKNIENHRSRLSKACKQEAKWQNWVERNARDSMQLNVWSHSHQNCMPFLRASAWSELEICHQAITWVVQTAWQNRKGLLSRVVFQTKTDGQRFCPYSWEQHYCQRRPAWQPILAPEYHVRRSTSMM